MRYYSMKKNESVVKNYFLFNIRLICLKILLGITNELFKHAYLFSVKIIQGYVWVLKRPIY